MWTKYCFETSGILNMNTLQVRPWLVYVELVCVSVDMYVYKCIYTDIWMRGLTVFKKIFLSVQQRFSGAKGSEPSHCFYLGSHSQSILYAREISVSCPGLLRAFHRLLSFMFYKWKSVCLVSKLIPLEPFKIASGSVSFSPITLAFYLRGAHTLDLFYIYVQFSDELFQPGFYMHNKTVLYTDHP